MARAAPLLWAVSQLLLPLAGALLLADAARQSTEELPGVRRSILGILASGAVATLAYALGMGGAFIVSALAAMFYAYCLALATDLAAVTRSRRGRGRTGRRRRPGGTRTRRS